MGRSPVAAPQASERYMRGREMAQQTQDNGAAAGGQAGDVSEGASASEGAGDLLLYVSDGSIPDRIVARVTDGPYVHVEVDMGDGTAIGALAAGVSRHPLVTPAGRVPMAPNLPELPAGLAWLAAQVTAHDEYGWADLADAIPNVPILVSDPDGFDCSHLAAAFILHAGGAAWLGTFADAPGRVSPNDLARLAGLLAPSPHASAAAS